MAVITYPCWDYSQTMLVKGATEIIVYILMQARWEEAKSMKNVIAYITLPFGIGWGSVATGNK